MVGTCAIGSPSLAYAVSNNILLVPYIRIKLKSDAIKKSHNHRLKQGVRPIMLGKTKYYLSTPPIHMIFKIQLSLALRYKMVSTSLVLKLLNLLNLK